ncbi:tRNA methyltransferase [Histoplasma ohiense]|nr:tRNA methyltransferase [Histoplasma ohiense (nom. inval.)]
MQGPGSICLIPRIRIYQKLYPYFNASIYRKTPISAAGSSFHCCGEKSFFGLCKSAETKRRNNTGYGIYAT